MSTEPKKEPTPEETVVALLQEIYTRISGMDGQLTAIEEKLEKIEESQEELEGGIDEVLQALDMFGAEQSVDGV